MMAITCLNVTLKNFADIEQFPGGMLQELFNSLTKICKTTNELPIKLCTINCYRYIFKMKMVLHQSNVNEFIKVITKFLQVILILLRVLIKFKEKNEELKICTIKTLNCLLVFVNPSDISSHIDNILPLCIKVNSFK